MYTYNTATTKKQKKCITLKLNEVSFNFYSRYHFVINWEKLSQTLLVLNMI